MIRNFHWIYLILAVVLNSCGSNKELPTVDKVDLNRYQGLWCEIARLPNRFEKGLECTTANYTLRDDGKIEVVNSGIDEKGEKHQATGTAWLPDPSQQGRLKVSFFWPFSGDYYIIALDEEYQHVLVGSPSRKYLWVLARNKTLDADTYTELIEISQKLGFDIEKMEIINQNCD